MIEKLSKGYERFRNGYFQRSIDACEKTAVGHSMNNLMTYPWIRKRVNAGSLHLVGCYYDLRNGELIALDEITTS